jgi:hypothetical protein
MGRIGSRAANHAQTYDVETTAFNRSSSGPAFIVAAVPEGSQPILPHS